MLPYSILGSVFFGSSLARIVSLFIISKFDINLFSSDFSAKIPGFSSELAGLKTYDIVNISMFGLFTILLFFINLAALKIFKEKNRHFLGLGYSIFAILVFLQTYFVAHSGTQTIVLIVVIQLVYFIGHVVNLDKSRSKAKKKIVLANGFIAGFFLLLIANNLTTSVALPLGLFITTLFFYAASGDKLYKITSNPAHLLLIAASVFPLNTTYLLTLGLISGVVGYLIREKDFKKYNRFVNFLYPLIILFIFVYNPLFYLGTFDSVEEGFWLGWLQRMLVGQSLYTDAAVFHPPLIAWGLYLFSKLFGASIYHFRLYLNILQIAGVSIIFVVANKLLKKPLIKILAFWLILSFTATGVRNNVEIRLGMGLLSMLPIYYYLYSKRKSTYLLILSGVFSSLSLFTSIEVGASAIITLIISAIFFLKKKNTSGIKRLYFYLVGVFLGALPIVMVLWAQGALKKFVQQIFFYSKAFSSGYLNSAIERTENLTLLQWHVVNRYLSSPAWFWEITRMGLLGVIMFIIYKLLKGHTGPKERFAAVLATFSVLLFRPILARSDVYHLLLVLIISIIFIAYLAEEFSKKIRGIDVFVLLLIGLFFARGATQLGFLQNQLIKFQTYGNPSGNYPSYKIDRAKILTGTEVNTKETDDLIFYIKDNVSKQESIFVYPWMPEIYFLSDSKNSTSFDTPLAFFTEEYQRKMINELVGQNPKFVIYNPEMNFANLTPDSLPIVNRFIKENFTPIASFGDIQVLEPGVLIDRKI